MYPLSPEGCNFHSARNPDLNSPLSGTGVSARTAQKGTYRMCPCIYVHSSVCPSRPTGMVRIRAFVSFAWVFGACVFNNCQIHLLMFESTREKLWEKEATKAWPCRHACLFGLQSQKANRSNYCGVFLPFPCHCSAFQTPTLNFCSELLILVLVTGAVQAA